jgi:MBG domain (YGX type)/Bacterial Ig-like domain (group 3)/Bacterial lectin
MKTPIGKLTLGAVILAVLAAGSTTAWAQSCPANPYYSPDFTSNEACLTLNGNASFPSSAGSSATITSWSSSNGVVTFEASNSFTAGEVILLSGFANSTFFNGLAFPVLKAGLSKSQFEINFSGSSGSSDTGTATPLQVLRLTPNKLLQAGSAWFNTQQPVSGGFSTTFTFQLRGSNTFNADGFAFVIQNSSSVNSQGDPTALGPNGCGIGFGDSASGCTNTTGGIPNSLAVEFNTYLNQGVDQSGNSVSIQSNGTNPNCIDSTCTLAGGLNYQLPVTLTDGNIHVVQVSYSLLSTPTETNCLVDGSAGPCLDVIVDGNDLFPAGVAVNLGTLLSLNSLDNAWVGFTAGTGAGDDNQDILSWTFTTQAQSQSGTLTTTAPTVFNFDGGQSNGGNDYNAQLTSGSSTTAVVTEIPMLQSACNALVQANPLFNSAECFVYQNGGGPGLDTSVMYELTCPGSPTGGTCGSMEIPDFQATLGSDFDFSFGENSPLTANTFGLPNLTSQSGLPAVGYLKGSGPDPLHPCTPYANNTPPLFQSNQILSFALGDTSGGAKGRGSGTGSCWLVTYDTPSEVPSVGIIAPANNAIYQQGSTQLANYSCNAVNQGTSTSGPYLSVASCTATDSPGGSVANGAQFDTTTLGTHTFTAFVTDSALNTNSATVTYDVQTTQTITFSPIGNQTYGVAPITLNATASSGLTPVTFSVSGPASVSGNTLTITGAGSVTVQASQAGNGEYASTSTSQTITVYPAVLTVTANNQNMVYGSAVPALTVTYNQFVNGDGPGSLSGTLSCSTTGNSSSPAGSYPITCAGQSSANYSINYVSGTLTISKAATTTSLSSTPNPSAFGQAVTFTASITQTSGSGETGTVTWSTNTGCGTTSVTSGTAGTATCVTSVLAVGNNTVTATYSGDGNHSGSAGTTSQTVSVAGSVTALVSSANPSLYGNSVSFNATVTPVAPGTGTPTGTVTFTDGTTTLGAVALIGGQAVLTTSALTVGAQSITASYGGSSSFSSSSATIAQTVNQLPALTCVNAVTFSAGVAGSFTVAATGFPTPAITESGALPSGITFTSGSGTATLSGTTSAVGTYIVTLSASNAVGTVTKTFTVVVAGPAAVVSPTSVAFTNVKCNSTVSNSVTLTNGGNATLTISRVTLTLGANTDQDDFTLKNGCSSSLTAGKSCSIAISYYADDGGSQSATLFIKDNAVGSPQQVSITGTNTCKPDKD